MEKMALIECLHCKKLVQKKLRRFNESLKNGWNFYCSWSCRYKHQENNLELLCTQCGKPIQKTPGELRKVKKHVFCSKSCAASYNNSHKKYDTRRSKLEQYIEQKIKETFANLLVEYNSSQPIGVELDLFFPELKLAIEVNGIVRFRPIFGAEKLQQIQLLDKHKAEACTRNAIELLIVNTSEDRYLAEKVKEKHWGKVKEFVALALRRADHTNEQVP
ncbi:MAG: hypothetical protein K1Y36_00905 [Blastocatellia bacterium]|nr:hypothetical protein [Blastocatellia bacterium]